MATKSPPSYSSEEIGLDLLQGCLPVHHCLHGQLSTRAPSSIQATVQPIPNHKGRQIPSSIYSSVRRSTRVLLEDSLPTAESPALYSRLPRCIVGELQLSVAMSVPGPTDSKMKAPAPHSPPLTVESSACCCHAPGSEGRDTFSFPLRFLGIMFR